MVSHNLLESPIQKLPTNKFLVNVHETGHAYINKSINLYIAKFLGMMFSHHSQELACPVSCTFTRNLLV